MPRGNRKRSLISGPQGQGPMTGRGAGFCAGYDVPRYANDEVTGFGGRFGAGYRPGNGRGQGFGGRGFGFGFRQRLRGLMPNELTAESEKAFLQNRVEILARELEDAKARLAELIAVKES